MKGNARLVLLLVTVSAVMLFLGVAQRLDAQGEAAKNKSGASQFAEQKFKNIQVLKGIPAEQLVPSMQFIVASLGVECEFCHVEHAMDKDDKKEKVAARKMITMMMAINKAHFDGEREVTCYTCHRGAAHPVGTPILSGEPAGAMHRHEDEGEEHPALPPAQKILEKYLAAMGGADALLKIKTRVQKGNIDSFGEKYPIEIFSEAPDKRISISHPSSGASITAYNGQTGWLAMPRGFHQMTAAEQQAASIDAQLYLPARLPELYQMG
jgi:hypothetical protein